MDRGRRMLTGMTVIAALLLAVSMTPATAATGIVARWKLDDPKTPANGPVADSVGTHPGTVGDTTGTLIKRRQPPVTGAGTNTYSYYFKGWREGWSTSNMCPSVTPNGALVTVSDVGPGPNGGGGLFDPKLNPFEFTVNLKGDAGNASPIPISGCSTAGGTSLNVMQQGLFHNAGGQYKMQILGNGDPECWFSDDAVINGGAANVTDLHIDSPVSVYNGSDWFTVSCRLLRPTSATATAEISVTNVTQGTATVTTDSATKTFGGINPCTGTDPTTCPTRLTSIYFGKKPGSTDPRDAFSGWLDNVTFKYL